jgi:hypothetical protein
MASILVDPTQTASPYQYETFPWYPGRTAWREETRRISMSIHGYRLILIIYCPILITHLTTRQPTASMANRNSNPCTGPFKFLNYSLAILHPRGSILYRYLFSFHLQCNMIFDLVVKKDNYILLYRIFTPGDTKLIVHWKHVQTAM